MMYPDNGILFSVTKEIIYKAIRRHRGYLKCMLLRERRNYTRATLSYDHEQNRSVVSRRGREAKMNRQSREYY
jgi:hypothetical protein